jgi:hypothetical protein
MQACSRHTATKRVAAVTCSNRMPQLVLHILRPPCGGSVNMLRRGMLICRPGCWQYIHSSKELQVEGVAHPSLVMVYPSAIAFTLKPSRTNTGNSAGTLFCFWMRLLIW